MRLWLAIFFSFQLFNFFSQPGRIYTSVDYRQANPDSVFILDLSKAKLTEVPSLKEFHNLEVLNLSKNKIVSIPIGFNSLKNLKKLDLSKNKLTTFPIQLCALTQLKDLSLSENDLISIPDCIGYFTQLERLDLFATRITDLPASFAELRQLVFLDMRGINLSEPFQTKWRENLSNTTIEFDQPCNCLEKN